MNNTDKLKRLAEAWQKWGEKPYAEAILALIAENERLKERVVELEEGLLNMKMVGDAMLSGMAPWQAAGILHGEYFSRLDAKEDQ